MSEDGRFVCGKRLVAIGLILVFAGLMLPFALWVGYHGSGSGPSGTIIRVDYQLVAMLWQFNGYVWGHADYPGPQILNPFLMQNNIWFGLLPLLSVYQVLRYLRGRISGARTIFYGLLCYIPIISRDLRVILWALSNGYTIYSTPIPLLLVLSVIIMRVFRPKELSHPWEYLEE